MSAGAASQAADKSPDRASEAARSPLWRGLSSVSGWVSESVGLRRALLAFGAGGFSVLAMAPFFFFPALIIGMTVLVWLLDGCARQQARSPWRRMRAGFWAGWWYAFGYFLPGLLWVGNAFLVDAATFAWIMPFAVTVLPAGLALLLAVPAAIYVALWRPGPFRIALFAALWTLGELVRGHIFTGFPWNLPAYTWAGWLDVAQSAAWIGSYGLSFLTVLFAAAFACLGDRPAQGRARPWMVPAAAVAGLAVLWSAGAARLALTPVETVEGVTIRIVQPATRQADRMDRDRRPQIWARLLALTADAREKGISHVVWPEAAPPFLLPREPERRAQLAELMDPGMVLITGSLRAEEQRQGGYNIYNSLLVMDGDGAVLGTYDKHHLVPFGEYIPFPRILSALGIQKIVQEVGATTPGPGPRTLGVPGAPAVGAAICYEIVFPGAVVDRAQGQRPGWIVNVTDDDWFGDTSGPRQHLATARMRAIEENLPVVRAANNGISLLIDPLGRSAQRLELGQAGVLDVALPAAGAPSLFTIWGHWPVLIVTGLLILLAMRKFTHPRVAPDRFK